MLFSVPAQASVTLGVYGSTGASGWTTFTQDGGGVKRWVDPVSGLDSNNGILVGQTEGGVVGNGAWQTLAHAATQINNGDSGRIKNYKDNWLLLKKGTTFAAGDTIDQIQKSGQDAQHPLVIGAYDPSNPTVVNPSTGGARPIVKVPNAGGLTGFSTGAGGGDFFAVVGIDFIAYQKNPDDAVNFSPTATSVPTGINLPEPITWGLIEDCRLQYFNVAINVPSGNWQNNALIIRRNVVAFGFPTTATGTGQGIEVASVTNLTLEENFLDHNTWSESSYFAGATVSVSSASPGVVTWTGNKLWNGAQVHFSSGAANGISNNTEYVVSGLSGSTFTLLDTSGNPVNTTGTSTPVIVWDVPGAGERGFDHNTYLQGFSPDAETTGNINDTVGGFSSGPHTVRGDIFSRSASGAPFRIAGTFTDNLSVNNPFPWAIFNGINFATTVSNNVFLEAVDTFYSSFGWGISWVSFYAFDYYNLGSGTFSGNIFANSLATSGFGAKLDYGSNGWTLSNNILFNWKVSNTVGPSPPYTTAAFEGLTGSPISYGAISGTYPNATGSIVSYGSVAGTFPNATGGITGFGAFTGGPFDDGQYTVLISRVGGGGGQAVITVSGGIVTAAIAVPGNYGTVAKIGDAVTCLLPQSGTLVTATSSVTQLIVQQLALSGGTGTGAIADFTLNSSSQVTNVKTNANSITAVGYKVGDSLSGTLGGPPFTVSVASIRTAGIALSGGSGTGAHLMAVVSSTGVDRTYAGELVNPLNGNSVQDTTTIGVGYVNGETLSGTLGGAAFSVQISAVGTNTITGNTSDPTGTNSEGYPAPTRTIETYVASLGLGSTAADFYAAANANAKYNWNPALTANNGVNPYIRAGFGISATSSGGSRSWIGRF